MIEANKKIYLLDRSGAETADKCPQMYWWQRLEGKRGIVPIQRAEALEVGGEIHEDLQAIAEMEDIGEAAIAACVEAGLREALEGVEDRDQIRKELAYRRFGWAAAFALFIEPKIRAGWRNVGTERELILDRDPLWVPVTPDRVLESLTTPGLRIYREYKSTISSSGRWLGSWRKKPQLHLGLKALEEDGMKCAYAQIMGLMKGQVRDGRLSHPYVWGYFNNQTGAWTHDYSLARSSAWGAKPVWEYPGGLVEWVKVCGRDVAESQFPHTEPIFIDPKLLDNWIARWTAQMAQWGSVEEICRQDPKARAIFFPQHTDHCEPPFGDPCPYRWACWNAQVNRDPLGSGYYMEREPHHEVELIIGGRK